MPSRCGGGGLASSAMTGTRRMAMRRMVSGVPDFITGWLGSFQEGKWVVRSACQMLEGGTWSHGALPGWQARGLGAPSLAVKIVKPDGQIAKRDAVACGLADYLSDTLL